MLEHGMLKKEWEVFSSVENIFNVYLVINSVSHAYFCAVILYTLISDR